MCGFDLYWIFGKRGNVLSNRSFTACWTSDRSYHGWGRAPSFFGVRRLCLLADNTLETQDALVPLPFQLFAAPLCSEFRFRESRLVDLQFHTPNRGHQHDAQQGGAEERQPLGCRLRIFSAKCCIWRRVIYTKLGFGCSKCTPGRDRERDTS
eukprot:Selendium_serpulae@DN6306_c1_g2_i2.p1